MDNQGFNKIELTNNSQEKNHNENGESKHNKTLIRKPTKMGKVIKALVISFTVLLVIVIILGVAVYFPAKNLYKEINKTADQGKNVYTAIKNQNIEEAKTEIDKTKTQLESTKKAYQALKFTAMLPFIGNYYRDGEHLLKAAEAGIDAAKISVESLIPYADLLGLKGKSTFVSGSADQRIQTAVSTLDKLTPNIGQIADKIEEVKNNLDAIDLNRYPEKIGKTELRSKLVVLKETFDQTSGLFIKAKPLLVKFPSLLGQPDARKYLVIFQNDKELRPTGGFITGYAVFKIDKGKLTVETADDIYKLDERNKSKITPPKPFISHLKVYQLYLRDSNYDPDFIESMQRFEEIYNNISGTTKVNGIIAVDTHVLVEAMKILGPIPAYGTNFTVDNDKRCDCPQVIYELEDYAGRRVNYIRENRKDIIGVLLYQIMQKALGVSPSQYWGRLFQMAFTEFNQKHILVYMKDEDASKGLQALNYDGRMQTVKDQQDYLHINNANLGGAKSNMFVRDYIKVDYAVAGDGVITKTVSIDYKNPSKGSIGCNLELGGLCLNGLMPNWLRVYVPKGSTLSSFDGSEDPTTTGEAYGKTYFEGFLTVKPESISQVKMVYTLPFKLGNDRKLSCYFQKQPGTEGSEVIISVNGKDKQKFELKEDKVVEVKL